MRQDELSPVVGCRKSRKRVGRGDASGHGSYSGRGCKGQNSRSGGQRRPGLQGGGTLPLFLHLPRKRGFTNIFRTDYNVVNLQKLGVFAAGSEVTPEEMQRMGLVKSLKKPVKVLADGELNIALKVRANRFSAKAKAKIEAAGGSVEEVEYAGQTD